MRFFNSIRNWSARRNLAKKSVSLKRMRQVVNFHRAKKVGIIFESTSEALFVLIKQYVVYLKEEHGISQVMALGYVNAKEEPAYHRHQLNFDYFTKKGLSWIGVPTNDSARNFIATDFDILIDFTKADCIPLQFVAIESKAKFKVGRAQSFEECYDLIIQVDDSAALDVYAKQINHFLTRINHDNEKQRV